MSFVESGCIPGEGQKSPTAALLRENLRALAALGLISGIINVLMLTGSAFMIQVYDRVLASRSLPTLVALAAIAIGAYVFQGCLDAICGRVLMLVGERIDDVIGPRLYRTLADLQSRGVNAAQETLQPFRDLEAIRGFMSGPGPVALFDLPWLPIYLVLCYLFHPLLGYAACGAAVLLIGITLMAELRGRGPLRRALEAQSHRNLITDNTQRGAEVARVMGMVPALGERWQEAHARHLQAQRQANYVVGGLSVVAKMSRMLVQSFILALGAYLAIKGEISAGTIIATSILSSRALAPVDQAIASWKGFIAARQGYSRLKLLLTARIPATPDVELPPPAQTVIVEGTFLGAPGNPKPIVRNIGLTLFAGQALGVIGPSASGKSTLARGLVGSWQPLSGKVMFDGANLAHWDPTRLGAHIGYLPQDVQLFDGTVGENIARFQRPINSAAVMKAARAAGSTSTSWRCRKAMRRASGAARWSSPPGRSSVSGLPVRSTAIRSWWCSTSRTPISTPKVKWRCRTRLPG
jgi:PrtD family type I secretion system ABC transporter